jgi:hypothetical protein
VTYRSKAEQSEGKAAKLSYEREPDSRSIDRTERIDPFPRLVHMDSDQRLTEDRTETDRERKIEKERGKERNEQ